MNKIVLVTGGAGYIGSHTSYLLQNNGYKVIIIDNLIYNQPVACPWATFIKGDFADGRLLDDIFSHYDIDVVMHFAGLIEVGQSVTQPHMFYENNVIKTISLLKKMLEYGVKKVVFSSSCAVYGLPHYVPIDEQHPLTPVNPYGRSKLAVEYVLQDYAYAYGLKYVSLRYFNAAGALIDKHLGEWHNPETHVIPNLMRAVLLDKVFCIYGSDYSTIDGSCVRDYVHVIDISQAHVLAYEYLKANAISQVFNVGAGIGYSVKQLIYIAEQSCGKKINITTMQKRPGDVPTLLADNTKIKTVLGWKPCKTDFVATMRSAYEWERRRCKYGL
jgi:UDP-glucose 4-epimerase